MGEQEAKEWSKRGTKVVPSIFLIFHFHGMRNCPLAYKSFPRIQVIWWIAELAQVSRESQAVQQNS